MSRTAATTSTVAVVQLQNILDPNSGANVNNSQQAHNETFDAVGMTGISDATRKNYSSNQIVTNGDSHKTAIGKIDAEFHNSTGHAHSGAAGDGAPVSAANLTNFNKFFAEFQSFSITGAAGTTDDISTQMTGKTPGGGSSTLGVITTGGNNRCHIVDSSTQTFIEDADGQRVYGRITEAAGVWTISYYTNEAGVETAHSLTSTNINVIFLEVFSQLTRPTIPSNPFEFGTLDVTADVVDASATVRGVVNVDPQSFAGLKTFGDGLKAFSEFQLAQTDDPTTTGANQTLPVADPFWVLTNASLTSVSGITSNAESTFRIVVNKTGATITLKHDDAGATAANRILITGAANLDWQNNQGLIFIYDTTNSRWILAGGSGGGGGAPTVFGSTGTPRSVVAATGITSGASHMSTTVNWQNIFVVGSISGESDISANPQISNGTLAGQQEMTIIGTNDSDFILLEDGNGLRLTGPWRSYNGAILRLLWNGTVWTELYRSL